MTIDEIYQGGNLSTRSHDICKKNKIKTITDLTFYYKDCESFKKLKGCGEKSNKELIKLYSDFQGVLITENIKIIENVFVNKIEDLNQLQKKLINDFITFYPSRLNLSSINALNIYFGKSIKQHFSIEAFVKDDFKESKIKNIIKEYSPELGKYFDTLRAFIVEISKIKEEKKILSSYNRFLFKNISGLDEIPCEISDSQSVIEIFNFFISDYVFESARKNDIFVLTLNVFKNQDEYGTNDISELFDLRIGLVKQIRQQCLEELFSRLSLIKLFNDDFIKNYDIDIKDKYIIISNEKVEKINSKFDTSLTSNFMKYLFFVYLSDDFSLIGNVKDVLIRESVLVKNRHKWKNIYLIKKKYLELIDFDKLLNDIDIRKQKRNNETYKFNFKSYLTRFLKINSFEISDDIKYFCENIINEELHYFLDSNEDILFKRNTAKIGPEYCFEALEKLGKPSTVDNIFIKITELFPEYKTDKKKVRSYLKRKHGFVPIGRTSVFGLQKWENEFNDFKGGTIRSIVKEFLENYDTPQHISEITKYVLQYRPKTNENSILQNLRLDESNVFVFFKNLVIGISEKKYDSSYHSLNEEKFSYHVRTWEVSYKLLENFAKKNNGLPLSNSCIESEKTLYNWFLRQKTKMNKGELSIDKVALMNDLIN